MKKLSIDGNKDYTVKQAYQKFMKKNKVKKLANSTMGYYQGMYIKFSRYLKKENITNIKEITDTVIDDYNLYLQNSDLSINSVVTYLKGLRAFLYYCMKNDWMEEFKITLPKGDKNIKKGYSEKQLKRLLKKPNLKKCTFAEYRNWVIINFLLDNGCRSASLRNVKIKDLNFEDGYVTFTEMKHGGAHIVPMSETLISRIIDYLEVRNGKLDDYLFPNVYNEKISRSGLRSAIKRYNTNRDVAECSIHAFRHEFSRLFIKNGGTIYKLKQILGHKSIETTDNYVKLLLGDIKQDYSDNCPLENLVNRKKTIKMEG